jgi:cupin 2 domain-containing protein
VAGVLRGRLDDSESAPTQGEVVERLVSSDDVIVEHILSGRLESPVDYEQDHDEWVAVLEGSARVEISGETLSLTARDWLLLPRGTAHRLIETTPGTRWLAVHFGSR